MILPKYLDIEHIQPIFTEIVSSLQNDESLVMDFRDIEEIDFCGIQLIIAVFTECYRKRMECSLIGTLSPRVINAFCLFGLRLKDGASATDIQEELVNMRDSGRIVDGQ
jgi:anti-anti-sigma regulatory factor